MGTGTPSRAWRAAALAILVVALSARSALADIPYAWGHNQVGQLGNGTYVNSSVPVPVTGLPSGVSAISAGDGHGVALVNDFVATWGSNNFGQLGTGNYTTTNTPVVPLGMSSGVTLIEGGNTTTLALQNGTLYSWGANFYGQLGNGTTTDSTFPTLVSGMSGGVTAVVAWSSNGLAIKNGAAYAWGYNNFGALGNGTYSTSTTPVPVSGMSSGVSAVDGGGYFSMAIRNGGVYNWGYNSFSQLSSNTPLALANLSSGATAIAGGFDHLLAVQNGTVYAWGPNELGELGLGTTDANKHPTPTVVPGLPTNIVDVATGYEASYALSADGRLWAWGYNQYGQLGIGSTSNSSIPQEVFAPVGYRFTSVDAGAFGNFALATIAPAVPEPAAFTFMLAGGAYLLGRRDRRARRSAPGQNLAAKTRARPSPGLEAGVLPREPLQLRPELSTIITPCFWPGSCSRAAQLSAGPGVKNSSQDCGRRTGRGRSVSKHVGEHHRPNAAGRRLALCGGRTCHSHVAGFDSVPRRASRRCRCSGVRLATS